MPNPWLLLAGVLAMVASAAGGYYLADQVHAGDVAEHQVEEQRLALAGYQRAATITAQNQALADKARKDSDALRARNQKLALSLAALTNGLQLDADKFAAGGADDTLEACHRRARILADLLGEGANLLVEGSGRVEDRTREALTLDRAWPQ